MEFTHEEMRLKKRREQLDQILPELSAAESLSLQPVSKVNVHLYICYEQFIAYLIIIAVFFTNLLIKL